MPHTDQDTSRFISLILRHKPETIGIALDEHGWANVVFESETAVQNLSGLLLKDKF